MDMASYEPPPPDGNKKAAGWFMRWMGKSGLPAPASPSYKTDKMSRETSPSPGLMRRVSRKVVPGLPRAKTFKRQQSEVREKLEPIAPSPAERRAVSVDRRAHPLRNISRLRDGQLPRASAPEFLDDTRSMATADQQLSVSPSPLEEKHLLNVSTVSHSSTADTEAQPEEDGHLHLSQPLHLPSRDASTAGVRSTTTSLYEGQINRELESRWILNLSMHFRDKSKREKFFVTYRENDALWRRVTISLDYRDAPDDSLEKDLLETKFQREKSAKIYEAIRESLDDIQFYSTVTNLKLQTTDGRLHVHVVEDVSEIIHYPTTRMVHHLRCRRIPESALDFDSHMSGFVYKVRVDGQTLIKKEIPGPDTVDEFLYEVNALSTLKFSSSIIKFYGVVVDDANEKVKGLLIDYAEQGALIDLIYDSQEHGLDLSWATRERWARQIVQGLADVHEAGFVQGDFTLSNIVIDDDENAKIIDINRRGCPVGWEPPEATPLIDSNQRISMYIGVKSDLYQLGMVLWALATLEDEPEAHRRPLHLDPEIEVPAYYRRIVEICLSENPRVRLQATALLAMFPKPGHDSYALTGSPPIIVEDDLFVQEYRVENLDGRPQMIRTITRRNDWPSSDVGGHSSVPSPGLSEDSYYYPPRGRSPPSPLPSFHGHDAPHTARKVAWYGDANTGPSSTQNALRDDAHDATPGEAEVDAGQTGAESRLNILGVGTGTRGIGSPDDGIGIEPAHLPAPATGGGYADRYQGVGGAGHRILESNEPTLTVQTFGPGGSDPVMRSGETRDGEAVEGRHSELHGVVHVDAAGDTSSLGPAWEAATLAGCRGADSAKSSPEAASGKQDGASSVKGSRCESALSYGSEAEIDLTPSYTYSAASAMFERCPEADASRRAMPGPGCSEATLPTELNRQHGDLAGIGSAYGAHDEVRQQACSDEDVGLSKATASQNVPSQA